MSTLPFAIDDPNAKPTKGSDINEMVVDLYNQGKSATATKHAVIPKSLPLITTNYDLKQEERYSFYYIIISTTSYHHNAMV